MSVKEMSDPSSPSELFQAVHMSSTLMCRSARWKLLCLALESRYFRSSLRNWGRGIAGMSLSELRLTSMCTVCRSSHLVRLGRVHRPVSVVVHQFVDAADRLKTQQGVLILTELLIYRTQIYNTGRYQQVLLINTKSGVPSVPIWDDQRVREQTC